MSEKEDYVSVMAPVLNGISDASAAVKNRIDLSEEQKAQWGKLLESLEGVVMMPLEDLSDAE